MFNLIRSIRSFIPKRAKKEEDTGFTCSVYDMKNGETVLNTHDIDELLKFLGGLDYSEPDDGDDDGEEDEPCGCRCCDTDCEECECDAAADPDALCELEIPVTVNVIGTPVKAKLKFTLTEVTEA